MTIWRYPLPVTDHQTISLPLGARVLSVGHQHNEPSIWVLVDENTTFSTPRTFHMLGTGYPTGGICSMHFLGTLLLHDGSLVFHVFEEAAP